MTLEDLGYKPILENYRKNKHLDALEVGRITVEHKERYKIKNDQGEYEAELLGNFRFNTKSRSDFPAVGDWVAFMKYDENKAIIHEILPRETIIERQAVGKFGEKQIIATNIDYALIVQAVDRDFKINRLERYLTICHNSKVKPIIVISKIDTIDELDLEVLLTQAKSRVDQVPIIAVSNKAKIGYNELISIIERGKTYCLLGSSGVGKSTLINALSEQEIMKTGEISSFANRGKHITSHRELMVLKNGGIFIDNPGMREVGITDNAGGIEITFDEISELAKKCKFNDCSHMHEKGCAILQAMENEEIDQAVYYNYLKLIKETAHFESSIAQKRKRDREFGKMIKQHLKFKKQHKF